MELSKDLLKSFFEERKRNCHKGNFGYVTLMGGCTQYLGAAKLASLALASLRSGCGVTRLAIPASLTPAILPHVLEVTLCPMPDKDGKIGYDEDAIRTALTGISALGMGMGWDTCENYHAIIKHILQNYTSPVVIDAGGLNALAEDVSILKGATCPVVLTPHPKEFSRLLGISLEEVLANGESLAQDFARTYGVILLLKGANTIVTDGTTTYTVTAGCAGMATAGSGDVLTGILTGMSNQKEIQIGNHLPDFIKFQLIKAERLIFRMHFYAGEFGVFHIFQRGGKFIVPRMN